MRIGELSERTGVSRRSLRYYEEQGLLVPSRDANSYRDYPADAPLIVEQIQAMFASGLNSDAIRRFLPCARGSQPSLEMCADLRALLEERTAELNEQAAALASRQASLAALLAG